MTTLDDDPIGTGAVSGGQLVRSPEPAYGEQVAAMLTEAAKSKRIRTQVTGKRAQAALDALAAVLKRERLIVEHEDALARLKRGED